MDDFWCKIFEAIAAGIALLFLWAIVMCSLYFSKKEK